MEKFVCTNCGKAVEDLYKQFGGVAMKLTKCGNCNLIADKYLEYDLINIVIDLILLRIVAIRHFLFNSTFKNFWKLSIILLLLESYSNWSLLNRHSWENHLNDTIVVSLESNIYLDDLKFYALVLRVFLNTLCYVLLIQAFTRIYTLFNNQCTIPLLLVWKTITISNCSLFLTLPAFIWDINVYDVHSHFIYIYSTLSQLLFYRALSNSGKIWSIFVILISIIMKKIIFHGICLFQICNVCCDTDQ